LRWLILLAALAAPCGCRAPLAPALPIAAEPVSNPTFIPAGDAEFVYEQVVDTLDDYFKLQAERRMKLVGGLVTPGRIDTFPVIGATVLEPWRADAGLGPENVHNTLQTIRRYAIVELLPTEGGYLISVSVMKELEDVSHPEDSTIGGATLRHDGTLVRTREKPEKFPITLGWIPLGRDQTLEQRILCDIQSRLQQP
jgi:hypothetical protein